MMNRESLLTALEQISAAASHDLGDPLKEALQAARMLACDLNAEQKPLLGKMTYAISTVLERLALVREYGYLIENTEPVKQVHLSELVQDSISRLKREWPGWPPPISVPALPIISGRKRQLGLLVYHLLKNAVQHADNSIPVITLRASNLQEGFMLEIQDNGKGVASDYHHFIFGLFCKLAPESDGHGAGLTLARQVAINHGGTLEVLSISHGMCLRLTLPLTR